MILLKRGGGSTNTPPPPMGFISLKTRIPGFHQNPIHHRWEHFKNKEGGPFFYTNQVLLSIFWHDFLGPLFFHSFYLHHPPDFILRVFYLSRLFIKGLGGNFLFFQKKKKRFFFIFFLFFPPALIINNMRAVFFLKLQLLKKCLKGGGEGGGSGRGL